MAEPIQKDKGLGDTIVRMTTRLGIKPCGGCKKRAEVLNRVVTYREGAVPGPQK